MMINTLELDGVILAFKSKRVLQDIYLKCVTGQISGLLGRNGSGKSCLLKIIYGDLVPVNRSVRINQNPLYESFRAPEDMRFLPQTEILPKGLRAKRIFREFNLDFSDFVSLFPDLKHLYMKSLRSVSGGERRIIEIYVLVASKTRFCLLDEPFSHVMPLHIEAIKSLILREKKNKGILVTDHMYKHILDISDELYLLSRGKTYLTKGVEDLLLHGYLTENSLSNM